MLLQSCHLRTFLSLSNLEFPLLLLSWIPYLFLFLSLLSCFGGEYPLVVKTKRIFPLSPVFWNTINVPGHGPIFTYYAGPSVGLSGNPETPIFHFWEICLNYFIDDFLPLVFCSLFLKLLLIRYWKSCNWSSNVFIFSFLFFLPCFTLLFRRMPPLYFLILLFSFSLLP